MESLYYMDILGAAENVMIVSPMQCPDKKVDIVFFFISARLGVSF